MEKRDIRFDVLRLVSAFAVVWLHVSARVVTSKPSISSLDWWAGNLADAMSRWCVPVFVMVSGALLLTRAAETSLFEFYKQRARRILPPLVFWTLFYLSWSCYRFEDFRITAMIKAVIIGQPYYHMWYLYMIIGLYAVAPFLHRFVDNSASRYSLSLIIIILSMSSLESFFPLIEVPVPEVLSDCGRLIPGILSQGITY